MPSVVHVTDQYANNRAEVSHQPTRQRVRQMRRFTSAAHVQRFASVHGVVQNLFQSGDIYSGRGTTACSEGGRSSNGMRRRVRAERARANDLEAEQRTVHTKWTVSMIPLPIGVALRHGGCRWAIGLTHKLTDLRSWLLNCRSSLTGASSSS